MLVVLVVKDGARWLRHSLLGLSKQTHPRVGVLAVDNASSDGSAALLAQALGPGRVIGLSENVGFAGAVKEAMRSPVAGEADYLLLMHDDTVLAPDAISRMVDAAERIEGAGVVGPKVLDWEHPRLLRDIGMSTDRFGSPYSPLEEGEIDQGQYDRIREVLFVSSCAMLVAKQVWSRIGSPDERYFTHDEDLDFCWRARLAGFRVLVTPVAEARHRGATLRAERADSPPDSLFRYHRERSSLASILKNYGLVSLLWVLPSYAAMTFIRIILYLVSRRFEDAGQVVAAWGWNIAHLPGTLGRRRRAQAARAVPDRAVRTFMAPAGDRLRRWAGALRQALFPATEEAVPESDEEEAAPKVAFRVNLARFVASHPVASAWLLAAFLSALAFRNILATPTLAGGALPAFPDSAFDFFRELASGIQHTGLGGTQSASPALGALGLGSLVTLGSPSLLQKALLVALPALAGAGCYRAIRSLCEGKLAAVMGALAFALSPLTLWGISEGRISTLAFLAGLPWLAAKVIDGFRADGRRRWGRWVVGFALGLATMAAFYPGAVLAAGLLIAVTLVLPPVGRGRARGAGLAVAGVVGAAVLAFPVALALTRGAGSGLVDGVGTPSMASVIRLSLAPGPGAWTIAFALPVAAVLGFMYVSGPAARVAAWAALAAVGSIALTWLAGAGHLPQPLANPVAFIAVAAFAYAVLLALGLASVFPAVARHAFGARQLSAALLGLAVVVTIIGQAAQAARGSWRIGPATDVLSDVYPSIISGARASRVLWVGQWEGGALPPPAGLPQGRVEAGKGSVRYAVTDPAGASALDLGRPVTGPGYERLEEALASVFGGDSRHGGALLVPFGIRMVVADPDDVRPVTMRRLRGQLDLDVVLAGDLVIFQVAHPVPLASVISDPGWLSVAKRTSFARMASLPAAAPRPLAEPVVPAAPPPSPEAMALLSQQFDDRWRAEADGRSERPFKAFGWAVGFEVDPTAAVQVRYGGQRARTGEVLALALLWLGALWVTRRPATRG